MNTDCYRLKRLRAFIRCWTRRRRLRWRSSPNSKRSSSSRRGLRQPEVPGMYRRMIPFTSNARLALFSVYRMVTRL